MGAAVSAVGFGILQSSKHQAPNPKEAPSTKLQNERPLMLDKGSAVAGRPSGPGRLWDLKLGASLELGVWSLELGVFPNPPTQKALPQPERCRSSKAPHQVVPSLLSANRCHHLHLTGVETLPEKSTAQTSGSPLVNTTARLGPLVGAC